MRAPWLALVCACAPPVTPPVPPSRPVIDLPATSASTPWVDPTVILKVQADDGSMVMVFLDADCAGLPLLREPIERLRAGIELDVVHGPNVFSAKAIDGRGTTSTCSDPVTLEGLRPSRGMTPAPVVLRTEPAMPSRELTVRLLGTSPSGFRVRVWSQPNCSGKLLASAASFGLAGIPLTLAPNTLVTVSVDGARGSELTQCSRPVELENDTIPPDQASVRFFPAEVRRLDDQYLIVTNDTEPTDLYDVSGSADCAEQVLTPGLSRFCSGVSGSICHRLLVAPDLSEKVSVRRIDRAGNASCVVLLRPAFVDTPPPALTLTAISGGTTLNLYAATSILAPAVDFFQGSTCAMPSSRADEHPTPTIWVKVGQLVGAWSARIPGPEDAGVCAVAQ